MDDENADPSAPPRAPTVDHVKIPFASPRLLWRTKQTYRDKDAADRAYLLDLINRQERKF